MNTTFLNKESNINVHSSMSKRPGSQVVKNLIRDRWLYILLLPGILYFLAFKYLPMWGVFIAFKNYQPALGFFDSPWVGLKHFQNFIGDKYFFILFKNTLIIAFYNLAFFFPLPIIISLLLNEIMRNTFKRFVQSMIYVPHFVSWVVVAGLTYVLLGNEGGAINELIAATGGSKVNFLMSEFWFRPLIVIQIIWKETGWGTIIFLAALSGVDVQLYESAHMDGANRWQQLWSITLPSIRSTIVILLILRLGNFLDTGFEQIFLMVNEMNRQVGEVFDTYVYTMGITQGQFSYTAAVGLFKSVIGFILVLFSNQIAKRIGEEGIY